MSKILIVVAVVILAVACRTYRTPAIRRLGSLGILVASFLGAYFISGSIAIGVGGMLFWFLLPWFEILTRIREMRLPMERTLDDRMAPSSHLFPELDDLTEEAEEAGFEQLSDCGWNWDETDQFLRSLWREEDRTQAAFFFTEQEGINFYHTALVTRTIDGRHLLTWDYPFSYTLQLPDGMEINRIEPGEGPGSFARLVEAHEAVVETIDCPVEDRFQVSADDLGRLMREDMRRQIEHNLDTGIIKSAGEGTVRYSTKGYFFLWFQIVRDMLRLG